MTTAYLILGIACFAVLFAELSGIPQHLVWWINTKRDHFRNRPLRRLKPFDCALCLSFWIALTWFSVNGPQPENVLHAAVASVTAYFITKLAKK